MRPKAITILLPLVLIATSLRGASNWTIAEHENLTIVSNAGAKRTQQIFEEIELFKRGIKLIFDGTKGNMKWPLKVIA